MRVQLEMLRAFWVIVIAKTACLDRTLSIILRTSMQSPDLEEFMDFKTLVVVNPNSANGMARQQWPKIQNEIARNVKSFEYVFTAKMGHATELTREGIKEGFGLIVAVGGDGTNNEVVNGFFEDGKAINPDAIFAHITQGTGGDLRKTLGTPKSIVEAAKLLAGTATRKIDLGLMTFLNHQKVQEQRYFINITSFGIGGEVDARVNRTTKIFGGFASFLYASLSSTVTYKNKTVQLKIDDQDIGESKIYSCAVANGRYFGGGMMMAPDASMDDGVFDIVIMGDLTLPEIAGQMSAIYKGAHINHPKVQSFKGKQVTATSTETVLLDVDGEQPGSLPATFMLIPDALTVKVADR